MLGFVRQRLNLRKVERCAQHQLIRCLCPQGNYTNVTARHPIEAIDRSLAGKDGDGKPVDLGGGNTAEVMRRQPDGSWRYIFDNAAG